MISIQEQIRHQRKKIKDYEIALKRAREHCSSDIRESTIAQIQNRAIFEEAILKTLMSLYSGNQINFVNGEKTND
jgi:hypothetical protein